MYLLQLFHRSVSFRSLPFGLERWIPKWPEGLTIKLGVYVQYKVDTPAIPPIAPKREGDRQYRYSSLNPDEKEIRLLEILPGQSCDGLELSLITVSLLKPIRYEALSYAWGSALSKVPVYIDGQLVNIRTQNLVKALHSLRRTSSSRLVWVDALSINQDDFIERGHQVSIMDEVYQTAQNVVVYLGEPTTKTATAMDMLGYFVDTRGDDSVARPWENVPIEKMEDALEDIIRRPWFERMWTVQEATLARRTHLVIGPYEVAWDADVRSLRTILFRIKSAVISPEWSLSSHRSTSDVDWSPLLNILDTQLRQAARREQATISRTPLDLAFDFRKRQCYDPRDRYYAIFSIVENDKGGRLILQPDYTLPVEELHRQFTEEVRRIGDLV